MESLSNPDGFRVRCHSPRDIELAIVVRRAVSALCGHVFLDDLVENTTRMPKH